jgi:hypothetical protein
VAAAGASEPQNPKKKEKKKKKKNKKSKPKKRLFVSAFFVYRDALQNSRYSFSITKI